MTKIPTSRIQEEIRTSVRQGVMEFVANNPVPQKQQPLWQRVIIWAGVLLVLSVGFWLTSLFLYQITTNSVLADFVGWSFQGIVWIWFPETIVLGVFCFILGFIIKRLDKITTSKFANFAFALLLLLGLISSTLLIGNPSVVAENETYTNWLLADYRLTIRDQYVDILSEKGEFYGAVASTKTENNKIIIDIDHGGAVKTFSIPKENDPGIQSGDLLWLKYETQNGEKVVTDFKLIKL